MMRDYRTLELLLLLVLACLLSLNSGDGTDETRTLPTQALPESSPETQVPRAVLRWSRVGGCYARTDFYLELITDEAGSKWTALMCASHLGLIEQPTGATHPKVLNGNFIARGRLDKQETIEFIAGLVDSGALETDQLWYGGTPQARFLLELEGVRNQAREVGLFSGEFGPRERAVWKFLRSNLTDQIFKSLFERWTRGGAPDRPLKAPDEGWFTGGLLL